jgi:hypothetical protein
MKHVVALHPHVAGERVADGVIPDMAHVELAGGIRQHLQHVIFRLAAVGRLGGIELRVSGPALLPARFYLGGRVAHLLFERRGLLCRSRCRDLDGLFAVRHVNFDCKWSRMDPCGVHVSLNWNKNSGLTSGFALRRFLHQLFEGIEIPAVVIRLVDGCFGDESAVGEAFLVEQAAERLESHGPLPDVFVPVEL